MKSYLALAACGLLIACATTPPDSEAAHTKAVKTMLVDMGLPDIAYQGFERGRQEAIRKRPAQARFYQCIGEQVSKEDFLNVLVASYGKYYSTDDARKASALFESKLGDKLRAIIQSGATHQPWNGHLTPDERKIVNDNAFLLDPTTIKLANRDATQGVRQLGRNAGKRCVKFMNRDDPSLNGAED